MKLALLHRRLTTLMALAALTAFAAGAGAHSYMWGAAGVLALALFWRPRDQAGQFVERLGWVLAVAIFSAGLVAALVWNADYLPYTLAFLLVLLVTESLRSLDVRNEIRLYTLSFAVLIASTAYYPGVVFACAFAAYVGLATLALEIGYLRREAERHAVRDITVRRSVLAGTVALSTVAIIMSALVFLAFPRLPRGWIGSARAAAQGTMVGFGDGVSLGEFGGSIQPNPQIVFRVEFDGPPPGDPASLHWRGRSYDRFDGVTWSRSRELPAPSVPPNHLEGGWGIGMTSQYQIFGGPPGARVLFGLHPILGVVPRTPMRPMLDRQGDIVITGGESPIYLVRSGARRPQVEALLAAAGEDALAAPWYLQLPRLPDRVLLLADSLTRGAPTRYEAVRRVEEWLRGEFAYTLDLPATPREATLDHFLFERRAGHCEYFSTAMAVLLRAAGIPTRNVNGFLGGEWNASGGYLAVTQNDAHSWVEVWFPGLGWVPFDPTPSVSRNEVVGAHGGGSFVWPVLFWWDGLQHRWTKWVLFYDLDKQLTVARRLTGFFSGGGGRASGSVPTTLVRSVAPWGIGIAAFAAIVLILLRHGPARRRASVETRLYRDLRSAYLRAGYGSEGVPPLELAELVRVHEAPAYEAGERAIHVYLRARFGGAALDADEAAQLRSDVRAVKRELRRGAVHR